MMKLNVGIIFIAFFVDAIVVGQQLSIVNPGMFFDSAREYHDKVTELQSEIIFQLTNLQVAMTDVLRMSSNTTLSEIDLNIKQIFELERPVRDSVNNNSDGDDGAETTPCVRALRARLDAITEFSGYESSICVSRHDRSLSLTLNEINGLLKEYEGNFNVVQMIVVRSFISMNHWTQSDGIENNFVSEYERVKGEWHANDIDRENVIQNLSGAIEKHDSIMSNCFDNIRRALVPFYERFERDLEICKEFDITRSV